MVSLGRANSCNGDKQCLPPGSQSSLAGAAEPGLEYPGCLEAFNVHIHSHLILQVISIHILHFTFGLGKHIILHFHVY